MAGSSAPPGDTTVPSTSYAPPATRPPVTPTTSAQGSRAGSATLRAATQTQTEPRMTYGRVYRVGAAAAPPVTSAASTTPVGTAGSYALDGTFYFIVIRWGILRGFILFYFCVGC